MKLKLQRVTLDSGLDRLRFPQGQRTRKGTAIIEINKHTRKSAIILSLFLLSVPVCHATDAALALGDHLFEIGSYDAAITEYKRYLFFQPGASDDARIYRQVGLAYREQGNWMESVETLRIAMRHATNPEQHAQLRLDMAVTFMASGELNIALLECLKAESEATTDATRQRARFLRGVAHVYLHHWEQAREAFREYDGERNGPILSVVDAQLESAMALPQKSERVAKWLSSFLPGAGQIYAGEWRSGLNAFVLNGLLLSLTVDQALDRQFDNAILFGLWLFQRYYGGNRYRAAEAARSANEQAQRNVAQNILRALNLHP